MKSIAFIDPFGLSPVNKCVNTFILRSGLPCTYHMPSKYGFDSLEFLEQADAYVILGSIAHVTENLNWQKELLKFIIPKIESGIPTLGICYGHQLIAHHYGCKVGYIQEDQKKYSEVRDIEFTQDALGNIKGSKLSLAYAHAQMVHEITSDFDHFAESSRSKYDGLKLKGLPYWSLQAHPEASINFLKIDAHITDNTLIQKTLEDSYKLLQGFIKEI